MSEVEYKILQLKGVARQQERMLDHLNATEGWELVTVIRGRPTKANPIGPLFAYLKRPLDDGHR